MTTALSPDPKWIPLLEQAVQLIGHKNLAAAENLLWQVITAQPNNFDALQLLGAVRSIQNRVPEAEQLYRRALALFPLQPFAMLNLGHLLRTTGRPEESIGLYRQVAGLLPDNAAAHFSLAVALHQTGNRQEAEMAYQETLRLEPSNVNALIGLGGLLNDAQRHAEAETILRQVIGKTDDAMLLSALEHNLGIARNAQNDHRGAIAHFDRALTHVPNHHGAEHAKADALQFLGREDEAVEAFRRAIRHNPRNFGAHRDLNQLLYRLKRDDEFLKSYDAATAQMPDMLQFPLAKASFLLIQKRNEEALEIFEHVLKKAPDNAEALSGVGVAHLNLKQFGPAIAAYEKGLALYPAQREFLNGLGTALLTSQDAKKAATMAEYALTLAPYDQAALALLGTAWRLLNDEREYALNGYDNFIRAYDLEPPEGYTDMASFNRDLNAYMDGLHPDVREYIDQSLRNGTQTLGNIFSGGHDLVDRLKRRIEQAVARYIAELPSDLKHPLTSRRAGAFKFSGSWSSRLRDCGYHTNHVHPGGWISSAYYIALPETVADTEGKAGWIKFGEPGYDIDLADPVRRAIQPEPGRLVLFPSYMWHGTVPFRSARARTTIAFDVVPG